jgi:hypothetical protein
MHHYRPHTIVPAAGGTPIDKAAIIALQHTNDYFGLHRRLVVHLYVL